ncbi:MAG: hypothetical protein ACKO2P_05665 [Planctomycetota bacterium]
MKDTDLQEQPPCRCCPMALTFWQKARPGGRSWDGETVLRTPDFGLWIGSSMTRRAVDVNPPVTVRARAARTASGTQQSLTGRLTSTARYRTFFVFVRAVGPDNSGGLKHLALPVLTSVHHPRANLLLSRIPAAIRAAP